MQNILNSNKTSLVQNTLTKDSTQSLAYATQDSFPNLSKKVSAILPYITFSAVNPDNNQITFNIPRAQFLYGARLKFNYTLSPVAGGNTAPNTYIGYDRASYVGLNIVRQVDWLCNGQPFLTMTGEAFKAMTMNSPIAFQSHVYRYALPLYASSELPFTVDNAGATACVSYLPLFGSWFQSVEKALNCSEIEQIQLMITFKDVNQSGLSAALTNFTATLYTYKYMPAPEVYNQMVTKDFSKDLLMESFNTYTEKFPLSSLTLGNTFTFISTVFFPCYKTHVFIAKNDTSGTNGGGALAAGAVLGCPYVNIDNLSVDIGGENYFSKLSKSTIDYEQSIHGNGNTSVVVSAGPVAGLVQNPSNIITIDWSLLCGRDHNSGLASFSNLNKPLYTVDWTTAYTAGALGGANDSFNNYYLYAVHEFWTVLSVDSSSRILSTRANQ